MFRIFGIGVILGLIAAGACVHFVPLFDLHREASMVKVQPNGGNAELFHIQLPGDRLLTGQNDQNKVFPEGLNWPAVPATASNEIELFKLRNDNYRVVGVASRLKAMRADGLQSDEWLLYLPARGALYFPMSVVVDGLRSGTLRGGTHEFSELNGQVSERYFAGDDGEGDGGRIELLATLIAQESAEADGIAP